MARLAILFHLLATQLATVTAAVVSTTSATTQALPTGDPSQCPTSAKCFLDLPRGRMLKWATFTPTSTFVAATVRVIVNKNTNSTTTTTIFNTLPAGVEAPPTNADGTRVATVTSFAVTGGVTTVAYPSRWADYDSIVHWNGELYTKSTCTSVSDAVITLPPHSPLPQSQLWLSSSGPVADEEDPRGIFYSPYYETYVADVATYASRLDELALANCTIGIASPPMALTGVRFLTETETSIDSSTPSSATPVPTSEPSPPPPPSSSAEPLSPPPSSSPPPANPPQSTPPPSPIPVVTPTSSPPNSPPTPPQSSAQPPAQSSPPSNPPNNPPNTQPSNPPNNQPNNPPNNTPNNPPNSQPNNPPNTQPSNPPNPPNNTPNNPQTPPNNPSNPPNNNPPTTPNEPPNNPPNSPPNNTPTDIPNPAPNNNPPNLPNNSPAATPNNNPSPNAPPPTTELPAAPAPTSAAVLIIGTAPITALPGDSTFVVGSQTLTPGGTITISGTTVELNPTLPVVVVNGETSSIETVRITRTTQVYSTVVAPPLASGTGTGVSQPIAPTTTGEAPGEFTGAAASTQRPWMLAAYGFLGLGLGLM